MIPFHIYMCDYTFDLATFWSHRFPQNHENKAIHSISNRCQWNVQHQLNVCMYILFVFVSLYSHEVEYLITDYVQALPIREKNVHSKVIREKQSTIHYWRMKNFNILGVKSGLICVNVHLRWIEHSFIVNLELNQELQVGVSVTYVVHYF